MVKVQVCCTLSVAGQLLVWVKVPFTGEIEVPVMVIADDPSLVRVAVIVLDEPATTLPRLRDDGENPNARVTPVPVRLIVWLGLPGQLSLRVTAPERVPALVGVKVTVIVQLSPAFREIGR